LQPSVCMPVSLRAALLASSLSACIALRVPSTLPRRAAVGSAAALAFGARTAQAQTAAVSAQRFSIEPRITPLPPVGALSLFEDQLVGPRGSKLASVRVSFEFPSQWTALGKSAGAVEYVDGSTGLKTYVLTCALPDGATLASVPKAWFGDAIFSPEGSIARSGTAIDEFKVSSSKLSEAAEGAAGPDRRRLALKYAVVTPANQRVVERRAVVDAYEVQGTVYMLVASATGTKWEGGEKERCVRTADSFLVSL